jgi:hypothetical protein
MPSRPNHSHADGKSFEEAQEIVFLIVHAKLTQYPELVDLITARGGVAWLESCTQFHLGREPTDLSAGKAGPGVGFHACANPGV